MTGNPMSPPQQPMMGQQPMGQPMMGQPMMGNPMMGQPQMMQKNPQMMMAQQAAGMARPGGRAPKSMSTDVMEFTRACDQPCTPKPSLMSKQEVEFITKMIIDELLELNATVLDPRAAKNMMTRLIHDAKECKRVSGDEANLIAEQNDAFVDIWYYSLNAACKKGVNLSSIFQIVHAANMAKIDPRTGKCIKRADGKIMKPAGWQPPNIKQEIIRQTNQGAF